MAPARLFPILLMLPLAVSIAGCPPTPPPAVGVRPPAAVATPAPKNGRAGVSRAAPSLERVEWPGAIEGSDLLAVAALGSAHAIAVGVPGAAWLSSTGDRVAIAPFTDGVADAVWADGRDFAVAVGYGGIAHVWDGKKWSDTPTGVDADLHAVWGRKVAHGREVYAGGSKGVILRYTDGAWTKMTAPENTVISAFTGYGEKIWAVGQQASGEPSDGVILKLDGDAWVDACKELACGNAIYAAFATGPGDLWTGGAGGELVHYANGQPELLRSGTRGAITAIGGTGAHDLFVLGDGGFALWWNGKTWAPLAIGDEDLRGIGVLPDGEAWIVGSGGTVRHVARPSPGSGT